MLQLLHTCTADIIATKRAARDSRLSRHGHAHTNHTHNLKCEYHDTAAVVHAIREVCGAKVEHQVSVVWKHIFEK